VFIFFSVLENMQLPSATDKPLPMVQGFFHQQRVIFRWPLADRSCPMEVG
jgi:hypothetical protein